MIVDSFKSFYNFEDKIQEYENEGCKAQNLGQLLVNFCEKKLLSTLDISYEFKYGEKDDGSELTYFVKGLRKIIANTVYCCRVMDSLEEVLKNMTSNYNG